MSTSSSTNNGANSPANNPASNASTTSPILVVLPWLLVGTPLAYGLWQTVVKASALFSG